MTDKISLPYSISRYINEDRRSESWNFHSLDAERKPLIERGRCSTGFTSLDGSVNASSVYDEEKAVGNLSNLAQGEPPFPRLEIPDSASFDDTGSHCAGYETPRRSYAPSMVESAGSRAAYAPRSSLNIRHANHSIYSGDSENKEPKFHFGCPFPKHRPERYKEVCNACTNRPGWHEWKHLKEHVNNVHRSSTCCVKCRKSYKTEAGLKEHRSENKCKEVREETVHELMSAEQEAVWEKLKYDRSKSPGVNYRHHYHKLFPDDSAWETIKPDYDYLTPTYLVGKPSFSMQPPSSTTFLSPHYPQSHDMRTVFTPPERALTVDPRYLEPPQFHRPATPYLDTKTDYSLETRTDSDILTPSAYRSHVGLMPNYPLDMFRPDLSDMNTNGWRSTPTQNLFDGNCPSPMVPLAAEDWAPYAKLENDSEWPSTFMESDADGQIAEWRRSHRF